MYKVIIFTHGELGKGLLNSASMVSGPTDDVDSFSILPGEDVERVTTVVRRRIEQSLQRGIPVVVFTDLFFGTPFNQLINLSQEVKFLHITGVNLPMLIEALSYRQKKDSVLENLAPDFVEAGQSGIVNCSALGSLKNTEENV